MSVEENKELINTYIKESISAIGDISKTYAVIDKYFTPNSVTHLAGANINTEQWKGVAAGLHDSFSDINITIDDILADGDKVTVRTTWGATHTGEWLGVTSTGKKAAQTIIVIYKISNGKIAEAWGVTDTFGMMIQLGAIPNPYV